LSKHALQCAEEEHEVDVTVGGKLTDPVLLGFNSISYGCPSLYVCQCQTFKGTGIRGLMRGMATLPQGYQELLVVSDKVGRPPGELGVMTCPNAAMRLHLQVEWDVKL